MLFVTVGTHEQQFNRLVECMDVYATGHDEKVIIQTGFSTYEPKNCKYAKFYSYKEMKELITKARIVITHGGPSSFIAPLQIGKIPIVVPREKKYGEHVNDHQVFFCREVAKRMGSIIEIEDMNDLVTVLDSYDDEVKKIRHSNVSNNFNFCTEFEKIVASLFT